MEYPLRDDAYRSRLSSYSHAFPQCGVTVEKLAEAGFRVSLVNFKALYIILIV